VVERRKHLGGTVHDHVHESGIRIHTYGPHYFRTSSAKIWNFVRRYAEFFPYEAVLKTSVDGRFENWPIARSYIEQQAGRDWKPGFVGQPKNFEEASLAMMPRLIYEKFVRGYSQKQWGVPLHTLSPELAGRFDVRDDDDPRLKLHRYQGIPLNGYTAFVKELLRGIPVLLEFDFLQNRSAIDVAQLTIFTGPIDELFDYRLGRLTYRGQRREHEYHHDIDWLLPVGQVNYPAVESGPFVRMLEWKHMMPPSQIACLRGSVVTRETPFTPTRPDHYEYPVPDSVNSRLYQEYRALADTEPKLLVCGRLGEYRYFDMDQAIARAMVLAERIMALRQFSILSGTAAKRRPSMQNAGMTSHILEGRGVSVPLPASAA
jgi:UDP-galactopyranose mutase